MFLLAGHIYGSGGHLLLRPFLPPGSATTICLPGGTSRKVASLATRWYPWSFFLKLKVWPPGDILGPSFQNNKYYSSFGKQILHCNKMEEKRNR